MRILNISCLVTFTLIYSATLIRGELFTALVDLEQLLDTEKILIDDLDKYVATQEFKIEKLKRLLKEYQQLHAEATDDVQTYIANPINAYRLTKRLTTDWSNVEDLINFNPEDEFTSNVSNHRMYLKFPTNDDLNGAANALVRLQVTYNLDTSSIARGVLNGVKYTTELNSHDCFEIGRQLYNGGDYYYTILWMQEALNRLANEYEFNRKVGNRAKKSDILEYLAFSTFKEGDIVNALILTNELLELVPDHDRAKGNKEYYERKLKEMKGDSNDIEDEQLESHVGKRQAATTIEEKVNELCRGEVARDPQLIATLKCRYITNSIPYLKIAPFKIEEMSIQPYIVIYHDVLTDNEIEVYKNMSRPRFKRATVQNSVTGQQETAHYRISKSAWLKDAENVNVAKISRRIEDMTELSMTTAEELQVVNYGIGGHYAAHFDFARTGEAFRFDEEEKGNRIATVLFYMSDVEQGGATVFPMIDLTLYPRKGTAAFWYNLFASGVGDMLTKHAACPVLAGSKWVCNKWIHEIGQEFRRPCLLSPDHPEDMTEF